MQLSHNYRRNFMTQLKKSNLEFGYNFLQEEYEQLGFRIPEKISESEHPPAPDPVSVENIEKYNRLVDSFNAYVFKISNLRALAPNFVEQVKEDNPLKRSSWFRDRFHESVLGKACQAVLDHATVNATSDQILAWDIAGSRYRIIKGTYSPGEQRNQLGELEQMLGLKHDQISMAVVNVYHNTKYGYSTIEDVAKNMQFLLCREHAPLRSLNLC
jgi:hypothetical protein